MATSKILLPNGTVITVEGSPEEIKTILSHYDNAPHKNASVVGVAKSSNSKKSKAHVVNVPEGEKTDAVMEIVNSIKDSDDAESIETNILDRSSQIDRILLPLYISSKYHGNRFVLTTGEIAKILMELGVPINIGNVSTAISTSASKYVVGDKARKKGQPTRYKLTRRGEQYMTSVLEGNHAKSS
jgi:hypothetical protein